MAARVHLLRMWKEQPLARLIGGSVFILLAFLLSNLPTVIVSRGWPSTKGLVISRTLMGQRFEEYDGDHFTNIDGYIHYQYHVDGVPYTATAVYPYETALRYPKGKEVQVYYHPRDPAWSELETGWVFSRQTAGFLPAVLLVLGFYLLIREGWLKIRTEKSRPEESSQKTYRT